MPITPNGRRRSVTMGKYSKHRTDDCNLCSDTSRSFQDGRMAEVTVKFVHPNPQLIHLGLPFCLNVRHYTKTELAQTHQNKSNINLTQIIFINLVRKPPI